MCRNSVRFIESRTAARPEFPNNPRGERCSDRVVALVTGHGCIRPLGYVSPMCFEQGWNQVPLERAA
jgi:hypothetical protein